MNREELARQAINICDKVFELRNQVDAHRLTLEDKIDWGSAEFLNSTEYKKINSEIRLMFLLANMLQTSGQDSRLHDKDVQRVLFIMSEIEEAE